MSNSVFSFLKGYRKCVVMFTFDDRGEEMVGREEFYTCGGERGEREGET